MPVVNGLQEGVGIGFPRRGANVDTARPAEPTIPTEGDMLSCPTCGRQAVATEWPEVRCGEYGSIPGICPDCEDHNIHSVPVPARKRDDPTGPWAPKVGDRVRVKATGEAGHVYGFGELEAFPPVRIACVDLDGGTTGTFGLGEIEPLVPPSPVAAVVVRGLGGGETARVVLCGSEIEAAREQQRNGGVVVAGGQIVWA